MSGSDDELLAADRLDGIDHPASVTKVIGHDGALDMIGAAFQQGALHHGWIFSGPVGIGKASAAFLLAKWVLGGHWRGDPAAPLDRAVHGQVSRLAHPNLLYLSRPYDADRKRFMTVIPVDQVRRLNRFFATKAGAGQWRVCIVDSLDDLSPSAANAILKNLEEPPPRTLLFLIHHGYRSVLPTIRSRCRLQPFRSLGEDDLRAIMDGFELTADQVTRDMAMTQSDGSVRAALGFLSADGDVLGSVIGGLCDGSIRMPPAKRFQFSDKLLGAKNDQVFRLFLALSDRAIHQLAYAQGQRDSSSTGVLDIVNQVWETTREQIRQTETYNLDRRHLILTLLRDMERMGQAVRSAP